MISKVLAKPTLITAAMTLLVACSTARNQGRSPQSTGIDAKSCGYLLSSVTLDDDRLFSRMGIAPYKDYFEKYKRTARKAALSVFLPAFYSGKIIEDYEQVLREQHLTLMSEGYKGFYLNQLPVSNELYGDITGSGSSYPGKFIFEVSGLTQVPIALRIPSTSKGIQRRKSDYKIGLNGIPVDAEPQLLRDQFDGSFKFLRPGDWALRDHYLPALKTLLAETRRIIISAPLNQALLLRKLADYYQIGICSHLFIRGNNTIFLTQVNSLLELIGTKGLSPGILDYEAMSMDSEAFEALFQTTWKTAQK